MPGVKRSARSHGCRVARYNPRAMRRLFTILRAISLLCCVLVVAMWIHSHAAMAGFQRHEFAAGSHQVSQYLAYRAGVLEYQYQRVDVAPAQIPLLQPHGFHGKWEAFISSHDGPQPTAGVFSGPAWKTPIYPEPPLDLDPGSSIWSMTGFAWRDSAWNGGAGGSWRKLHIIFPFWAVFILLISAPIAWTIRYYGEQYLLDTVNAIRTYGSRIAMNKMSNVYRSH